MPWSTRELAELAGTSVRTVRHYHDVGLLDQPERGTNGYKHYGVAHLLRVLRIKRLSDLGIPLSEIAAMGDADQYPHESLRTLDAELATTIERLQRIRVELALILRQGSPSDLPPELGSAASELSEADRAYTVILARVLGPSALNALQEMLNATHDEPGIAEFGHLPADADEHTRSELAERMTPYVRTIMNDYPELSQVADSPVGSQRANHTLAVALRDLYNQAQFDVLVRVNHRLNPPDHP